MSYSDYTFQDKNPVKRWLQQRRMPEVYFSLAKPENAAT